MRVHVTVDNGVEWIANRWNLFREPQSTEAHRRDILKPTKYSVLAAFFNASTVLTVVAVAAALFASISAAVAIGSIAMLIRFTAEKELDKYAASQEEVAGLGQLVNRAMHYFHQQEPLERDGNIFVNVLNRAPDPNWTEDEVVVFYPLWKNMLSQGV